MSSLKDRLHADMKAALKAGDKDRLGVIRLIIAAIKQREVDERVPLEDGQVLAILDKMVKQRRESITHYEAGGRADLVAAESAEIAIIQQYLPQPLSEAEIDTLIQTAMAETGASGASGMGKIMAVLKPKLQGRADLGRVSARVKSLLGA